MNGKGFTILVFYIYQMVNRIRLFRHKWKFYSFPTDKKFKAKLNPVMIRAREEYLAQWKTNSWKTWGKRPTMWFHDDYMRIKQWMWDQTFYVQSSWCYYYYTWNTAELTVVYPIYQIDEQTRDIIKIDTCSTWRLSSAMLEILEPVDAFPRQDWWVITPGEKYDIMRSSASLNLDTYRDFKAVAWWNADMFIALHWPEHRRQYWNMRYQMYWTWFHYTNAYDDGYNYLDWKIYTHKEFLQEMNRRLRDEQVATVPDTPAPEGLVSESDLPATPPTVTVTVNTPPENAYGPWDYYPWPTIYGPRDYAWEAYSPGEPYWEPIDMQAAIDLAREITRATNVTWYTVDNNGDLTVQ